MEMEQRVMALEVETIALRSTLAAMQCAIAAAVGEHDHRLRMGLLEDLLDSRTADWLTLPIEDEQLHHATQAFEAAGLFLRYAFLRAYTTPEARNPPPRQADGIVRVGS